MAYVGKDIAEGLANSRSSSNSGDPSIKVFRPSKVVEMELNESNEVLDFVLNSQDRYKAGDYGDSTSEQKEQKIGHYVSTKLAKTLIIADAKDHFFYKYENEVALADHK